MHVDVFQLRINCQVESNLRFSLTIYFIFRESLFLRYLLDGTRRLALFGQSRIFLAPADPLAKTGGNRWFSTYNDFYYRLEACRQKRLE
jgi:hypothetical protein